MRACLRSQWKNRRCCAISASPDVAISYRRGPPTTNPHRLCHSLTSVRWISLVTALNSVPNDRAALQACCYRIRDGCQCRLSNPPAPPNAAAHFPNDEFHASPCDRWAAIQFRVLHRAAHSNRYHSICPLGRRNWYCSRRRAGKWANSTVWCVWLLDRAAAYTVSWGSSDRRGISPYAMGRKAAHFCRAGSGMCPALDVPSGNSAEKLGSSKYVLLDCWWWLKYVCATHAFDASQQLFFLRCIQRPALHRLNHFRMQIAHGSNSNAWYRLLVQQRIPTILQFLNCKFAGEFDATMHGANVICLLDANNQCQIIDWFPAAQIFCRYLLIAAALFRLLNRMCFGGTTFLNGHRIGHRCL